MPKAIGGLTVAMLTPFTLDGELDLAALPGLIEHLIAGGADGLFVAGSAGECWAMDVREKEQLFEATMSAVRGRVSVIAGAGAPSTRESLALCRAAERAGCDAVSVVTPYYVRLSQREILDHYVALIEEAKLPVLAYNIPQNTGLNIEVETIAALFERGLAGVKNSSGDFAQLMDYLKAGEGKCVLVGSDPLIAEGLIAGCKGCISAPSNAGITLLKKLFAAYEKGDFDDARRYQTRWNEAVKLIMKGTFPSGIKSALDEQGVRVGPCRAPIAPTPADVRAEMVKKLRPML